jgi:hypothetical protein
MRSGAPAPPEGAGATRGTRTRESWRSLDPRPPGCILSPSSVRRDRAHASVAQLAEPLICNQAVVGSSPTAGSSAGRRGGGPGTARVAHWQRDRTMRRERGALRDDSHPRVTAEHRGPPACARRTPRGIRSALADRARSYRTSEPTLLAADCVSTWRVSTWPCGTSGHLDVLVPSRAPQGPREARPRARRTGRIPERPKGSDCKSDGIAFTGSNPVPPTTPDSDRSVHRASVSSAAIPRALRTAERSRNPHASAPAASGRSSMVERQPSKLNAWVRFPSPAP